MLIYIEVTEDENGVQRGVMRCPDGGSKVFYRHPLNALTPRPALRECAVAWIEAPAWTRP